MSKESTCKYNPNRHMVGTVYPFCTWVEKLNITLPPHVYLATRSQPNCEKCKCYEEVIESSVV